MPNISLNWLCKWTANSQYPTISFHKTSKWVSCHLDSRKQIWYCPHQIQQIVCRRAAINCFLITTFTTPFLLSCCYLQFPIQFSRPKNAGCHTISRQKSTITLAYRVGQLTPTKWKEPFRFGPTGIFGTIFEGSPLWPVWSFWLAGPKCPFPLHLIHDTHHLCTW